VWTAYVWVHGMPPAPPSAERAALTRRGVQAPFETFADVVTMPPSGRSERARGGERPTAGTTEEQRRRLRAGAARGQFRDQSLGRSRRLAASPDSSPTRRRSAFCRGRLRSGTPTQVHSAWVRTSTSSALLSSCNSFISVGDRQFPCVICRSLKRHGLSSHSPHCGVSFPVYVSKFRTDAETIR